MATIDELFAQQALNPTSAIDHMQQQAAYLQKQREDAAAAEQAKMMDALKLKSAQLTLEEQQRQATEAPADAQLREMARQDEMMNYLDKRVQRKIEAGSYQEALDDMKRYGFVPQNATLTTVKQGGQEFTALAIPGQTPQIMNEKERAAASQLRLTEAKAAIDQQAKEYDRETKVRLQRMKNENDLAKAAIVAGAKKSTIKKVIAPVAPDHVRKNVQDSIADMTLPGMTEPLGNKFEDAGNFRAASQNIANEAMFLAKASAAGDSAIEPISFDEAKAIMLKAAADAGAFSPETGFSIFPLSTGKKAQADLTKLQQVLIKARLETLGTVPKAAAAQPAPAGSTWREVK